MTLTIPDLKERIVVPAASSIYPEIGASYSRPAYEMKYSNNLVIGCKNYYDSEAEIPEGPRMSTSAEELAIQLGYARAGINLRSEKANALYCLLRENYWNEWQWTATGLRVSPDMRKPPEQPDYVDDQGNKFWLRQVLIGNEVVGEVCIPEGNGRWVVEWDEVFGLAKITTEKIDWTRKPYTTQSWFKPNPSKDEKSGYRDVAVGRSGGWLRDGGDGYLGFVADCERWLAFSGGYRPVQGSVPEIRAERTTTF